MKHLILSVLLTLTISLVLINATNAQPYGQIFTNQEADTKFGPVLTSITFSKEDIQNFLTQTNNYIMFRIVNNSVIVLDNHRMPLYPSNITMNSTDVFALYSTSVLDELLSLGNNEIIYIEQRNNVLSVTNGGYTMEVSGYCPPVCP